MGRLFWKFFLFIWLGQLAGVVVIGGLFWLEREGHLQFLHLDHHPPPEFTPHRGEPPPPPPAGEAWRPPTPGMAPPDHLGPPGLPAPRQGLPLIPLLSGFLVSLLCAAGLAWYFARPIRQLRNGLRSVAEGDLAVRLAGSMGGRRDELSDLGRDFDGMTERLQASVAGQKRLLHDVSHEMRSPLARLQAAIGLARQQPGRLEDCLLRIEREGERMNRLVGELLTLARLDAGGYGRVEVVDTAELLEAIAEDAGFEGEANDVAVDYRPGEMVLLSANPELLHRAVENVVRNALRHAPPGSRVSLAAGREADGAFHVRITDQGSGVPADSLEAIFQPFYRGLGQMAGDGYGLGLAIAQRVVESLGGKIRAENQPAGGLQVHLSLPLSAGR